MNTHRFLLRIKTENFSTEFGTLTHMAGEYLEADGPLASIGDYCQIETPAENSTLLAEVVAVGSKLIRMVPLSTAPKLQFGARVAKARGTQDIAVGDKYSNRAIDGMGQPIDGMGAIWPDQYQPKSGRPLLTMDRISPSECLITGIRAIDALLPLGKGQRIGIFAASGVGKTSLIEQIARQAECDRIVMCLVGERGREVGKLWSLINQGERGPCPTLIAATADEGPSMRLRAMDQAIGLAEYWRDRGEHVLLFIDSITRVALALREVGLAAGLPPTVRGLTPNVFSALPRFVERCGAARHGGAITAVLTVLSETDDVDDPIVELMKSVLDGHIVLSRTMAERRQFPAIDTSRSVSRVANELLGPTELDLSKQALTLLATFEEARPTIESGLYRNGSNVTIDRSIVANPALSSFLSQNINEKMEKSQTMQLLSDILHGIDNAQKS